MVERLKVAVEKARAKRAGAAPAQARGAAQTVRAASRGPASVAADDAWAQLPRITLDERHLENHRVITRDKKDPAYIAFDVLRTRIMRVFAKNGWSRVGITSPTKGCGKTFVAANLALSVARDTNTRVMLMDMDLRLPALAKTLGLAQARAARNFLDGETPVEEYLQAVGSNLAIGANRERLRDAAEVIMDPATKDTLDDMRNVFSPDIVIYDLPPMLSCDDVIGFLPQLDCILLVVAGDRTRPESVTECERLLQDQTHILGVLLNKAESSGSQKYGYEYGYGYT